MNICSTATTIVGVSLNSLVQWIGHSDLRAMAPTIPASKRNDILEKTGTQQPRSGDLGPTKTLLATQTFDEIRLLSNYPAGWNKLFAKWLECKNVTIVPVELGKPTDYNAIFELADAEPMF